MLDRILSLRLIPDCIQRQGVNTRVIQRQAGLVGVFNGTVRSRRPTAELVVLTRKSVCSQVLRNIVLERLISHRVGGVFSVLVERHRVGLDDLDARCAGGIIGDLADDVLGRAANADRLLCAAVGEVNGHVRVVDSRIGDRKGHGGQLHAVSAELISAVALVMEPTIGRISDNRTGTALSNARNAEVFVVRQIDVVRLELLRAAVRRLQHDVSRKRALGSDFVEVVAVRISRRAEDKIQLVRRVQRVDSRAGAAGRVGDGDRSA